MNEKIVQYRQKAIEYWNRLTNKQKVMIGSAVLFLLVSSILFVLYASRPEYINLYSNNLTEAEIGEIKAELDQRGYRYQLASGGTNIAVPRKDAAKIVVELAAEGIPKNGSIGYEIFSQNLGFGTSDRQLDVIEKDAMQNELRNLIKRISGVQDAEVMINLPEDSVFITAGQEQKSTASVVVEVEPGKRLEGSQIKALYYLVSRSVPNLPIENIVITNQYSELLTMEDQGDGENSSLKYDEQLKIQREIQQEIQQGLKNMLGTMMGRDKVYVYAYVKLNFNKVKSVENLVEPVDKENNQGLPISIEKITESFQGSGAMPGGVGGVGQTDVAGYPGNTSAGQSEYEKIEERVNSEVNRIQREIVSSPYEIEDLTINVGVEVPEGDPAIAQIEGIIKNVVRTSLASQGSMLTEQDIENRITVFPRTFEGKPEIDRGGVSAMWVYGLAAFALAAVGGMAFMAVRRRKAKQEEDLVIAHSMVQEIPDEPETDEAKMRKQIEKLAKQKPEEFATLLRTWLLED